MREDVTSGFVTAEAMEQRISELERLAPCAA
jgi:hypothetical protein